MLFIVQCYLKVIVIAMTLLMLRFRKYFLPMLMHKSTASQALDICVDEGPRYVVIRGLFGGVVYSDTKKLTYEQMPTIDNCIHLCIDRETLLFPDECCYFLYSQDVIAAGIVEFVDTKFVLHSVDVLATTRLDYVKKRFDRYLSKYSKIAIIIVAIWEVVLCIL